MTTASSPARRLALSAGLLTVALISCGRELTGPGTAPVNAFKRYASVAFAPQYETAVQGLAARAALLAVAFEKVRITLRREDGSIALDTVVDFPAGADALTLSLRVPLPPNAPAGGVPLSLNLGYVNAAGDTVFRGGPQAVTVVPSTGGNPPPPIQVPVHYTGPGALATRVVISPPSAAGTVGQLLSFGAQALGANGQPIANTPLVFTSSNAQVARVNNPNAGAVTLLARGRAFIYAQSLTGLTDSARVDVVLPASELALVSGGGQTARVSTALPQLIVAKVTASDGVPVSGVTVGFTVASGGGAVTPASAVSDVNGLVSAAWTLGPTAGAQSVTVTSAGLSGSPLSVSATAQALPVATTLVVSTQPVSSKITAALGAVVVTAKDATGSTAATFTGAVTVALASNPSGGTLGGTTTVTAVAGVATFSTLTLDRVGAGYSYTFTTPSLPSVTSTAFNVTAGDATRLAVGVVPSSVEAGGTLALTVSALDLLGNLSPFTGTVSLALGAGPAGARLSGTLSRSAVAGLATFPDLSVDRKGTGYTLVASAGGLASGTSTAFAVKAAEPTNFLLRRGNNQSKVSGTRLDTIEVQVLDVFGNGVEGRTVAFAITQGGGALAAASAVTDSAGIARPVWTVGGGAQQMTATLTGTPVLPVLTINATGLAGPAAKLVVATGPGTSQTAGISLTPAVVVQALDAGGVAQAVFSGAVTAVIASGPAGATLSGTTTVTAVSGVATFSALRLTKAGTYTLSFTSPNMTSASTASFVVLSAPAMKIVADSGDAQNGTAGAALSKPFVVLVADSLGNPVSGTTVTWAVASGGGSLSAASTTTDVNGRARATLTLGTVAGTNSVTVTSAGLGGSPLTFSASGSAGAAAQLVIISSSLSTAVSGVAGTVVVYAVDVAGNVATGFTGVVSVAIASGPTGATIGGPTTTTAVAGVATFAGVWLDKAGAYTATFSATGVASATSPSFVVSAGAAKNIGFAASSGNSQSGAAGAALASPLRVKVTDTYGNAVQGSTVTWSVTSGGGSVSLASGTSDALGEAATTWTLGLTVGTQTVTASSAGLSGSPVTFSATGSAVAYNKLWKGTTSTDWNTATNWLPTGVPAATDSVQIDVVTNMPVLAASTTIAKLSTGPGSTLSIGAFNLTVNGSVTTGLSSTISGTGKLILAGATGSIVGPSFPSVKFQGAGYTLAGATGFNSDVEVSAGSLSTNGFTANITGGLITSGTGTIAMTSASDVFNVTGNVTFGGGNVTLSIGELRVGGNFAQTAGTFAQTGGFTQLVGTAVKTIAFSDTTQSSYFQKLFDNGTGTVNLSTAVRIAGPLEIASGAGHIVGVVGKVVRAMGLTIDLAVARQLQVDTLDLWKPGTVALPSSFQIAVVSVTGAGVILSNGVALDGKLRITGSGKLDLNGKAVTVTGDFSTEGSGALQMQNALDRLTVNGNIAFGGGSTNGLLTNGKITAKGNFTQTTGGAAFSASGSHEVELTAAAGTTVKFDNPGSTIALSHFAKLKLADSSTAGTTFASDVYAITELRTAGAVLRLFRDGSYGPTSAPTIWAADVTSSSNVKIFDRVMLRIYNANAATQFTNATFQNFTGNSAEVPLTVEVNSLSGTTIYMSFLTFSNSSTSLYWVKANNLGSGAVTLFLNGMNPSTGTFTGTGTPTPTINWIAS